MQRYKNNPILTRQEIPEIPPHLVDVSSVFNPSAVKSSNKNLLMLKIQNSGRETFLLTATSDKGFLFSFSNHIVHY